MSNIGIIQVNYSLLEQVFMLPPDHKIIGIFEDPKQHGVVFLKIVGSTLPEAKEGKEYLTVKYQLEVNKKYGRFI